MAVVETIETGANSAINVGLGVFKTVEAGIQDITSAIQKGYSDLIARGAADNSSAAVELRSKLDGAVAAVRDVQSKVEGAFAK